MSDLIKFFPIDDLDSSIAEATKKALMDLPEFLKDQPEFMDYTNGDRKLVFPVVGVDFRTVAPTGHTGTFHPEVLTPNGIAANLVFADAQAGEITVPAYKSFTTYFVATVDDLPFELFTWAGDPKADQKHEREIPISIPVVQGYNVHRTAGRGEYLKIHGYFTVYGGSKQGGITAVKAETAKLYHAIRSHTDKFTSQGLTQLLIDPPQFSTFAKDAVLYEGVIKFTCVARIF